jgi:hypothetical protein
MMQILVDMALPYEEAEEEAEGEAQLKYHGPKYPYGLCIRLSNDELEKLGLAELPEVNDGMSFTAMAKVTSVSDNQYADGTHSRVVELQITHMALGEEHSDTEKDIRYG